MEKGQPDLAAEIERAAQAIYAYVGKEMDRLRRRATSLAHPRSVAQRVCQAISDEGGAVGGGRYREILHVLGVDPRGGGGLFRRGGPLKREGDLIVVTARGRAMVQTPAAMSSKDTPGGEWKFRPIRLGGKPASAIIIEERT